MGIVWLLHIKNHEDSKRKENDYKYIFYTISHIRDGFMMVIALSGEKHNPLGTTTESQHNHPLLAAVKDRSLPFWDLLLKY